MGLRQMTFNIPDEVADRFLSEVPASLQSATVAKLMKRLCRPSLSEEQWNAAASAANSDEQVSADVEDWSAFSDPIAEPWNELPPR